MRNLKFEKANCIDPSLLEQQRNNLDYYFRPISTTANLFSPQSPVKLKSRLKFRCADYSAPWGT